MLRAVLGELAEQLVLWDFRVRLDVPDAVHQMRVTSRSLRSVLRAAQPFFDGAGSGDYRVLRGGSWAVAPEILRPSFRNWDHPIRRQIFSGVRLAWSDDQQGAG